MSEGQNQGIDDALDKVQLLYSQAKYAEALDLALATHNQILSTYGKGYHRNAYICNLIGKTYKMLNDYKSAARYMQEAVTLSRIPSTDSLFNYLIYVDDLASLYNDQWDYHKAEHLTLSALNIIGAVLGKNHIIYAIYQRHLAKVSKSLGLYTKAESYLIDALRITQHRQGKDHIDCSFILLELSFIYLDVGRFDDAFNAINRAIKIIVSFSGESSSEFLQALRILTIIYCNSGQLDKAITCANRVLDISSKVSDLPAIEYAGAFHNLFVVYNFSGNYKAAKGHIEKTIDIISNNYGPGHPLLIGPLIDFAMLQKTFGNYTIAITLLRRALTITEDSRGSYCPEVAVILGNLGIVHNALGEYDISEFVINMALSIISIHDDHLSRLIFSINLNNLAGVYSNQGRYPKATEIHLKLINLLPTLYGQNHPEVPKIIANHAVHQAITGKLRSAANYFLGAVVKYDQILEQIFSVSSETARLAFLSSNRSNFFAVVSFIVKFHNDICTTDLLNTTIKRKNIATEVVASMHTEILSIASTDTYNKLQQLISLREQIASLMLSQHNSGSIEEAKREHKALLAKCDKLESEIASVVPTIKYQRDLRDVTCQKISNCLPDDWALVEFIRYKSFCFDKGIQHRNDRWEEDRYIALLITDKDKDKPRLVDLGEARENDENVRSLLQCMQDPADKHRQGNKREHHTQTSCLDQHGHFLRQRIFDPLLPFIGGINKLFISPDGELNILPLGVLPSKDGSWLIDKYLFCCLGVGRDILRFGRAQPDTLTEAIVISSPDYDLKYNIQDDTPTQTEQNTEDDDTSHQELKARCSREMRSANFPFQPMFGTWKEGKIVADKITARHYDKDRALKSIIKQVQSPKIIHFATHGFFLEDQKIASGERMGLFVDDSNLNQGPRLVSAGIESPLLRSGLVLAGANTWIKGQPLPAEAGNGILTAEEVSGMDLRGTEMVVLSACQTGLGDTFIGEGVMGLRRSFTIAGANTVIMSLWKVPDAQTQELMSDFYGRVIDDHIGRAEALRQAQLSIKKKYPDPYYWGAWICQGDPAPLPDTGDSAPKPEG